MQEYTTDTFFNGQLKVIQEPSGYRFSVDAVLLAHHAIGCPGEKILDLGTGCGIIPLIMAFKNPALSVHAVEVQSELADLAALNVKENHMQDRIQVYRLDMKSLKPDGIGGPVDLVVCNPPYRRKHSGRVNPIQQKALARHEIKATLGDVVRTARRMLRTAGRFVTIYAADRTTDLIAQMRNDHIEPKIMQVIYSAWNTDGKLILIEGVKGGRPGLKIAPPLLIYDEDGNYTDQVSVMFKA